MKTKKWKRDKKRWNNYWVLVSKTGDSGSWWRQAPGHPQWPSSPCRCCAWQPPLRWLTCWLELAVENQVTKIELQTCWAKMIKMSPELLVLKAHLFHTGNSNSEYIRINGETSARYAWHPESLVPMNSILSNVSHWAVWCAQLQNSLNSSHKPMQNQICVCNQ